MSQRNQIAIAADHLPRNPNVIREDLSSPEGRTRGLRLRRVIKGTVRDDRAIIYEIAPTTAVKSLNKEWLMAMTELRMIDLTQEEPSPITKKLTNETLKNCIIRDQTKRGEIGKETHWVTWENCRKNHEDYKESLEETVMRDQLFSGICGRAAPAEDDFHSLYVLQMIVMHPGNVRARNPNNPWTRRPARNDESHIRGRNAEPDSEDPTGLSPVRQPEEPQRKRRRIRHRKEDSVDSHDYSTDESKRGG